MIEEKDDKCPDMRQDKCTPVWSGRVFRLLPNIIFYIKFIDCLAGCRGHFNHYVFHVSSFSLGRDVYDDG